MPVHTAAPTVTSCVSTATTAGMECRPCVRALQALLASQAETCCSKQCSQHHRLMCRRLGQGTCYKLSPSAVQVNYRESISRPADIHYTHKKQSGGAGQYADISVKFEPGEPGSGFTFRSDIKGGAVSRPFCSSNLQHRQSAGAVPHDGQERTTFVYAAALVQAGSCVAACLMAAALL